MFKTNKSVKNVENFRRVQQDERTSIAGSLSQIHDVQLVPHHFLQVLCIPRKTITINAEEKNVCYKQKLLSSEPRIT